ncbi:glycosyltransferase [Azoarcus indigens]|uniref:Cellulose synthase/poly-beta-1,6-N-acetylglucosamine synthase-like glycosyltransferase n=1 Tax=Azoarcus indigens TaxID=29545 RepID=A0A4R6DJ26_9RHOO|nr:glycosyltransferase family 2 protein [Azoarcus indigens]NMG67402.1 glycosyltransferase [Azoarcus indigens]TDN44159.1 cellulose synthase/poly-beta-1,6-N-acetylglucosamine synthase-like glycosyltransferase [Azoarcus indigens]
MSILSGLLILVALVLLVPVLLFTFQMLVSFPGRKPAALPAGRRPRIAVLVPAHDEALGITATVRNICEQLQAGDRLLVVADNCSDDTAALATAAGAEVIVRHDTSRRGKGYALDFGVRHLASEAPEAVVIVDADCRLEAGALAYLSRVGLESGRPVQALYLMHAPPHAGLKTRIAAFAWMVKNLLRPLAYRRLGLPCQLMGTGMYFPWAMISQAQLASGHIVEDMKLGVDLARAGTPPLFCPEAVVSSVFPSTGEGVQSQRTRWEHGHLGMILADTPKMLASALLRADLRLAAMALDLCVPPLALLLLSVLGLTVVTALFALMGASGLAFGIAFGSAALLGGAVLLAWLRCGRDIVSFPDLVRAPLYALSKIPLYLRFLVSRQVDWVRSRRDGS